MTSVDPENLWRRAAATVVLGGGRLLIKQTTTGRLDLPRRSGALIVANHNSLLDHIVVGGAVYRDGRVPRFLIHDGVMKVPILGYGLRQAGQIPTFRGKPGGGGAFTAAIEALQAGGVVVCYPEGRLTTDPDGWPMHGRTGAARMWIATRVPVIPIAHWGLPRTPKQLKFGHRAHVDVVLGDPLDTSEWSGDDPHQITAQIMDHLTDLVAGLRHATKPAPAPR